MPNADVGFGGFGWAIAAAGGGWSVLVGLPLVVDGASFGTGNLLCNLADELLE